MELKLEKFQGTKQRAENRISVTASRSFGFPSKFCEDNNIKRYKFVVLYFDKKNKVVGFNFTSDKNEEHKFSLLRSKKGQGTSIVATSFFKVNSIDAKKYRGKYKWERKNLKGVGRVYIIKLKEIKREKDA